MVQISYKLTPLRISPGVFVFRNSAVNSGLTEEFLKQQETLVNSLVGKVVTPTDHGEWHRPMEEGVPFFQGVFLAVLQDLVQREEVLQVLLHAHGDDMCEQDHHGGVHPQRLDRPGAYCSNSSCQGRQLAGLAPAKQWEFAATRLSIP